MSTLQTTIEWEFQVNGEKDTQEREILVTYKYYGGCRGARGSCGEPIEPDEPPSVEITTVAMLSPTFHDRQATEDILDELTATQLERLEGLCMEAVSDDYEREEEEGNERHPHVYE